MRGEHEADDPVDAGGAERGRGLLDERVGVLGAERHHDSGPARAPRARRGRRRPVPRCGPPEATRRRWRRSGLPARPAARARAGGRAGSVCRRARSPSVLAGVPCAMSRTPVVMPGAVSAWTSSTTAARMPGSDSGSTPWPRLKTWPVPRAVRRRRPRTDRHGLVDDGPRRQAERGVEIALQRVPGPTRRRASSSGTRQSTPTTSDPAEPIRPSSSPVPTPKRMVGTPRSAMPVQDGAGGGQGEAGVLVGRERAGPAVEELDRLGAGLNLRPQGGHGHGREPARSAAATGRDCRASGP